MQFLLLNYYLVKMKVFITGRIPKLASEILSDSGFQVFSFNKNIAIAKNELFQKTKFADGIISLLSTKIDREFIDNLNNCKIIANYAVGYNNIDIKYAKEKEIVVTNTPDVLTDSTSDIAISLIFACARRIAEGDRFVRAGKFKGWKPDLILGQNLIDKTLGIIGAGRIGQETARKAKAFGLKILYYSLSKKDNFTFFKSITSDVYANIVILLLINCKRLGSKMISFSINESI